MASFLISSCNIAMNELWQIFLSALGLGNLELRDLRLPLSAGPALVLILAIEFIIIFVVGRPIQLGRIQPYDFHGVTA